MEAGGAQQDRHERALAQAQDCLDDATQPGGSVGFGDVDGVRARQYGSPPANSHAHS